MYGESRNDIVTMLDRRTFGSEHRQNAQRLCRPRPYACVRYSYYEYYYSSVPWCYVLTVHKISSRHRPVMRLLFV